MKVLIAALLIFHSLHSKCAAQPTTAPTVEEQQLAEEMQATRFRMPLRVVGNVTDADTGRPVPKFFVVPGSRDYEILQYSDTQECTDGKYEWVNDAPLPGRFVRIEADGYSPMESEALSEHIVATFDAKLRKAANIAGTVLTPDGKPASGARVMLAAARMRIVIQNEELAPGVWGAPTATTGADGRFSLRPADGAFTLHITHGSGCAEVQSAHDAIKLQPWGRIEGVAKIGSNPTEGQSITAYRLPAGDPDQILLQRSYNTTTDDSGRFILEKVAPGPVTLGRLVELQQAPGMSVRTHTNTRRIDVKPGETATVQIGGTGRPVVGKLVMPGGIPEDWYVFEGRLSVDREGRNDGSGHFGIVPNADGSFRVEDVEAGKYTLSITFSTNTGANPYQPVASATKNVEVPPMPGGRSDEPLDLGEITVTRQ